MPLRPRVCGASCRGQVCSGPRCAAGVDGGFCSTPLLGGLTMRTCGLQRRVRLLLCVAAVLLACCVSQGQYNDLQGQYQKLQQASGAQAAQSSADIAALKKEIDAGKVHVSRLQNAIKYTVNSDLLFQSGSWEMSPQGQEIIAKLVPQLAPFQQAKLVVNGYTDNAPIGR